ncbi:hydrogenase small subunit [Anaerosacchariphilus polymeriproducens]|uniref:Ni/Fe hydrogenase n=1 Tax=Anaerosacchariphilus polymeriproducens TaxID=1812858 RepID=A0A371ASI8_9FIRM|nr:hydrogenase small subunit [Anaerosacchariphilus polymeriproducens]RDU22536.1 Ni/Fe hydrogenase [Anaerosacchariphilus polymeriproducens]
MNCPMIQSKSNTAKKLIDIAIKEVKEDERKKINLIWLEATGCAGNIISLLNAERPDVTYLLKEMVSLKYDNSIMVLEGQAAFQQFIDTLETEYILVVEGAVSIKDNGKYSVIAYYNGKPVTAMEAVRMAGEKAKYVIAVGTCASFGGISSAYPNPSQSISVVDFLNREVIRVPGCPGHPDWVIGTIAHLLAFGKPVLDEKNRPVMFYGITVHDRCTRRSYFDQGIFANKLGDPQCMFLLGCDGPVTKADCPVRQWNGYVNWPIEDNTPCIGCAQENFPDGMEPFVKY